MGCFWMPWWWYRLRSSELQKVIWIQCCSISRKWLLLLCQLISGWTIVPKESFTKPLTVLIVLMLGILLFKTDVILKFSLRGITEAPPFQTSWWFLRWILGTQKKRKPKKASLTVKVVKRLLVYLCWCVVDKMLRRAMSGGSSSKKPRLDPLYLPDNHIAHISGRRPSDG